jgi:hypothetical protein
VNRALRSGGSSEAKMRIFMIDKSAGGREIEGTDPAVSRQVMPELMVKMAEFKIASDRHVILIKLSAPPEIR